MKILDRFRKRPQVPSTSQRKIRDTPGPMTAHEAWAMVSPIARKLDASAQLRLITSGLDIGPDGRSFTWEFLFLLPGVRARALLTVSPAVEAENIDVAPIHLFQRLSHAAAVELKSESSLPQQFRDSPEVVAALAAQGVDFVSGPSDMKVESRIRPDGTPVWVTYDWDEERFTPFTSP